jgi:hypothetical protein
MSALHARSVNAVLAVLHVLVLLPVRGLLEAADRTSLRTMLDSAGTSRFLLARRCACQPGMTWTITRAIRTSILRVAEASMRIATHLPRLAIHPLEFRHAPPVESPGNVSVNDETRDIDQCEPAGNPGRHHRGRPAR